MTRCLMCRANSAEDAEFCSRCAFPLHPSSEAAVSSPRTISAGRITRPDGSVATLFGGAGIVFGALLIIFSLGSDSLSVAILGGALAQLGLVFWLAGYIVRAISFLPGKDV